MKRFLSIIIIFFFLFINCSNPDKKATKLVIKSNNLLKIANINENESYSDSYEILKKILEHIELIENEYTNTETCINLKNNSLKIGEYSICELRNEIIPDIAKKASAEINPLKLAILLADSIENDFSKSSFFIDVSNLYYEMKDYSESNVYLEKALEYANSKELFNISQISLLFDIINVYNRIGNEAKTQEISKLILNKINEESSIIIMSKELVSFVQKYPSEDLFPQILKAFKRMKPDYFLAELSKYNAIANIAKVYTQVGLHEKSLLLADLIKIDEVKDQVLVIIIEECANQNQIDQAMKIFNKIKNTEYQIEAAIKISETLIIQNDYLKSQEYINYVLNHMSSLSQSESNSILLRISGLYVKAYQIDRADKMASKLSNNEDRILLLMQIAESYQDTSNSIKKIEYSNKAYNKINSNNDISVPTSMLIKLANLLEATKQTEKCINILDITMLKVDNLNDNYNAIKQLSSIAILYNKLKEDEKYHNCLSKIENIINTEESKFNKANRLIDLTNVYIETSGFNKAIELLDDVLHITETINDVEDKDVLYFNISKKYLELNNYDKAFSISSSIKSIDKKEKILNEISLKLSKDEQLYKAYKFVKLSKENKIKANMLLNIYKGLKKTDIRLDKNIKLLANSIIKDFNGLQ